MGLQDLESWWAGADGRERPAAQHGCFKGGLNVPPELEVDHNLPNNGTIRFEESDWVSQKLMTYLMAIIFTDVLGYDVEVAEMPELKAYVAQAFPGANDTFITNEVMATVQERISGCAGPLYRDCNPTDAAERTHGPEGELPDTMVNTQYFQCGNDFCSKNVEEARYGEDPKQMPVAAISGVKGPVGHKVVVPKYSLTEAQGKGHENADTFDYLKDPTHTRELPPPAWDTAGISCPAGLLASNGLGGCGGWWQRFWLPDQCNSRKGGDEGECGVLYAGDPTDMWWVAKIVDDLGLNMAVTVSVAWGLVGLCGPASHGLTGAGLSLPRRPPREVARRRL